MWQIVISSEKCWYRPSVGRKPHDPCLDGHTIEDDIPCTPDNCPRRCMTEEWVAASDRLPEECVFVLFSDGDVIHSGMYDEGKWYTRGGWAQLEPIADQDAVKYWMLLPDKVVPIAKLTGRDDGL